MTILISFLQFQEKNKIRFYKLFFRFFQFLFHSIPRIPIPIPRVVTLIPYIPTPIPRITTLIPRIPRIPIPRIPTLIPRVPTLIPRVPTLIACVPIIPLSPFPDSPFRLLQIAPKKVFSFVLQSISIIKRVVLINNNKARKEKT